LIKLEPNKDYNLSLGVKIFVSKGALGLQRVADSVKPYTLRLDYTKKAALKDAASILIPSLSTLIAYCFIAVYF